MLVGAAHPGATVGDVESAHGAQVSALVEELAAGVAASEGVAFGAALAPRLCAYARSVAHFPTALKEQPWRNGWFAAASAEALRAGKVDPYPRHTALLTQLGAFPK